MANTLQSPGVQVNERDISLSPILPTGTNIFVTGFTSKGPTEEVIQVTSVTEFEQIFGTPTTPAERYMYYTVKQILLGGSGNLYVTRLPYGTGLGAGYGNKYAALVYPVSALANSAFTSTINTASATYFLGTPKFFELTLSEYLSVLDGTAFSWSNTSYEPNALSGVSTFGGAGLVILNKSKSTINEKYEGYYVGLADNTNLLPTTDFNSILSVKSVNSSVASTGTTSYVTVPDGRLNFSLSATTDTGSNPAGNSVSQVLENVPSFGTYTSTFNDTLALGVFKLRTSPFTPDTITLDYVVDESYNGSLDYYRQINDVNGGPAKSFYLANVEDNSRNITVLVNDNISNRGGSTWLDINGNPTKKVRLITNALKDALATNQYTISGNIGATLYQFNSAANALGYADALYPLGAYQTFTYSDKSLGSIPDKLDKVLARVENDEVFDIDLIAEAGLGTIYSVACANAVDYYDDTQVTSGLNTGLGALINTLDYVVPSDTRNDLRGNYNTIFNKFTNLTEFVRKDCLFIADPLRHIFVKGDSTKVLSDSTKSFSQYIYSALRHQFELANTSYACTYGDWERVNDPFTGANVWVPNSGFAAADMATSDRVFQKWAAPAGFTRGRITGADDLAITPKQKERDQLYKIGINPITFFPGEGFVIFGQKTLLKQPSAFDRLNVRRLFLALEKATKQTAKFFVFEPNTLFTRTRVIDTLTPIFEKAKNSEGIYDYRIICDTRNNTPAVIDANELVVDIYIKPVRTAEFININFYATRTGTNFSELIG